MRDSSDRNLFDSALLACKELLRHINGEETIKDRAEIASRRALIKMASAESFYFFAKAVLGFDKLTGRTHRRWANDLQDKLKTCSYLMRMKPRGTYKTTLYGEALPLWLWATVSPHLRIMYTSANQALLDEVSAHLDRFIDYRSDSLYAFVFGITRDRRAKKNTNDVFNIVGRDNQAKGFSLILRPVGGSTNGIHPHIIIGDDMCFAAGTPVLTATGYRPIEEIKAGYLVVTRSGLKRVTNSRCTSPAAEVCTFAVNGRKLRCTANHRVITAKHGKVAISGVEDGEPIFLFDEDGQWQAAPAFVRNLSFSKASPTEDIHRQSSPATASISRAQETTEKSAEACCIATSGSNIAARFLRGLMSTTSTTTRPTTTSQTFSWSRRGSTFATTCATLSRNIAIGLLRISEAARNGQLSTTDLKKVVRFTDESKQTSLWSSLFARFAEKLTWLSVPNLPGPAFALAHASPDGDTVPESISALMCARSAARPLWPNQDTESASAPSRAEEGPSVEPVYNLTVEDVHEYVANGVLVANCDAEDRASPAVRAQKKQWWDSLNPLLVPFERPGQRPIKIVMLIGTRWHLDDVYQHVMSKNADVTNPEDRFDIEIEGVFAADGKLNYPEFFTEERINELKGKISTVFFSCQYLNQPLPEGSRIFEENRLHFVRPDQYDIRQGTNLCVFDPSQGKSGSDFPLVWWVNVLGNRKIFYRAIDQKIELSGVIGLLAQYNKEDLVKEILFENNGTMDLLEERVAEAHRAIGHPIQITKIHETRNKHERITATQPDLYNGSALFRADWRECYPEAMNQIIFFPAWGHDDSPDVVEKALTYISRNAPGEFVSSSRSSSSGSIGRGSLAGSLKSSNSRSISW